MRLNFIKNAVLALLVFGAAILTTQSNAAEEKEVLKVGIWEVGPFVVKDGNGRWSGLAVEVWEHAARETGLKYEYIPFSHHELYEAVKSGSVDVALSDIATDHDLEKSLQYSRTFFHSGLAIASLADTGSTLRQVFTTLTSPTALFVIGAMVFLILLGAVVFWVIENHSDGEGDLYNPDHKKLNFFNGAIWAILLLTAQEPDVFRNRSFLGRIFAMCLLAIGVTVSASYIAVITSAVTVNQMAVKVHGAEDLPFIKVGTLHDTRATKYMDEHHMKHTSFEDFHELMKALEEKRIDAVLADDVVLRYYIRKHGQERLSLMPVHLETEYYAIAFPEWSDLDDLINPAILEFIESPLWRELVKRHVGNKQH